MARPSLQIDLKLNRPQREALALFAPHRTLCLAWGRGVGKSYLMRTLWWLLVAQYDRQKRPGGNHAGVRIITMMPTLKQHKDVFGADILNDLSGSEWSWLGGKVDRSTWQIDFPGGSWIKPFPAAEHSSRSALGMRCDAIFLDEEDHIYSGVFDTVAIPWLSAPWSLGIIVGSGTPRRGRHGLHYKHYKNGQLGDRVRAGETIDGVDDATAKQLARHYSVFATYCDAPETVRPDAVALAKATTPRAIFQREWEHNFDAAEGLVYGDVWEEGFHVRIPPADIVYSQIVVGGDKGYEDPGVMLLGGIQGHGNDATVWILDEIYQQHKTIDWWCTQLGQWVGDYGVRRVYYDPSAAEWKASFRQSCAVSTPDVDNSREEGIDAVANMLLPREYDGEPRYARLYVHPRCHNLIRELSMYRRKPDAKDPDRYTDDIVDRDDHSCDALRYLLAGHFGLKKTLRQ